jgi:hypothetical protein
MAAMDEIVQAYRPVLHLLIRGKMRGQEDGMEAVVPRCACVRRGLIPVSSADSQPAISLLTVSGLALPCLFNRNFR